MSLLEDEADEISWHDMLQQFEDEFWPIFQRRGYSRDAALLAVFVNKLSNQIQDLLEET